MGLIAEQKNLTVIDPSFESKRQATHPGMAHFAGSGEPGKRCRECTLWTGCAGETGYYAKKGNYGGMIKPRACEKYRELMQGVGPGVPHDAAACRFFVENPNPPPIYQKQS